MTTTELPRNPRMLAKARTKIVRRRAVLRGVDAILDIVDQLINPTGRDLMKDMSAEMSLRQCGSTLNLWTVSPMKMRAELDLFADEDTIFKTAAAKFFDPPKRQG
jgi:hypothetical protein